MGPGRPPACVYSYVPDREKGTPVLTNMRIWSVDALLQHSIYLLSIYLVQSTISRRGKAKEGFLWRWFPIFVRTLLEYVCHLGTLLLPLLFHPFSTRLRQRQCAADLFSRRLLHHEMRIRTSVCPAGSTVTTTASLLQLGCQWHWFGCRFVGETHSSE